MGVAGKVHGKSRKTLRPGHLKVKLQKLDNQKKRTISLGHLGALAMFLSLILLTSYLSTKSRTFSGLRNEDNISEVTSDIRRPSLSQLAWDNYNNTEFGYSISYPKLLYKTEVRDAGGYLHFVRFEETKFSQEKGVAVGVSDLGFEEEVKRLKREFEEGGSAKLVKEEEVVVSGIKAIRLDLEPENSEEGEARTLFLVHRDGRSFSISTVPEQIERLIGSFKFL